MLSQDKYYLFLQDMMGPIHLIDPAAELWLIGQDTEGWITHLMILDSPDTICIKWNTEKDYQVFALDDYSRRLHFTKVKTLEDVERVIYKILGEIL